MALLSFEFQFMTSGAIAPTFLDFLLFQSFIFAVLDSFKSSLLYFHLVFTIAFVRKIYSLWPP